MQLAELAEKIGAELRGPGGVEVTGCGGLDDAGPSELSFLSNTRYGQALADTRAGAVILGERDASRAAPGKPVLIADDPYFAFRQAMVILHGFRRPPAVGISPEAFIHDTAVVGELCTVRPHAYIAPGAHLGDRVIVYPNCYIGKNAIVGNDCVLHPGVCVYDHCVLGDRVTLHANTVIGQDGLGYATHTSTPHRNPAQDGAINHLDQQIIHHKIPQAGNVVVGDDVEMGANCSIDRATVGSTVIGEGSKLSNNVVIGHGVKLGRHNLLVAHVGIAGSTVTGDHVSMGGQVGVAGHLTIGSHVQIAADAKVMHDIPDRGGQWGGTPAMPFTEAKRMVLNQKRVPALATRIKQMEKRLAALEAELAAAKPAP